MAKDLIRTRNQITKFYALKSQLQGVSLRIQVTISFNQMFYFFEAFRQIIFSVNCDKTNFRF